MSQKSGSQKSRLASTILLSIVLMLTTILVTGEGIIRYLVRNDSEILIVNNIAIPPLVPPLKLVRESINAYEKNIDASQFLYDENMGWINHPHYENAEEGISINSVGIRSIFDYNLDPAPDVLRIAFFGDSFAFSGGVADKETLTYYIEASLQEMGIQAEVINFGVPAYGADQAYLNWIHNGVNYQPDISILNYSTRMSGRALNIFRVISSPETRLPFSKPRFILNDGALEVVNSPALPIDDIMTVLKTFETSPLRQYESYYDDRYTDMWWRSSKFLSYVIESLRTTVSNYIDVRTQDIVEINGAIIDAFAKDVQAHDSVFMLGHLPTQKNQSSEESDFGYYELILGLKDRYPLIDAIEVLPDISRNNGWLPDGHYASIGNQLVGKYFAEQIVTCITSQRCELSRFNDTEAFRVGTTDE